VSEPESERERQDGQQQEAQPTGLRKYLTLAQRASWNVLDQVLSALTNAVIFFIVARTVSTAESDGFATAFYLFSLLIGIERAVVGQVFGIRFSDATGQKWRSAVARGLGTTLGITLAAAALMIGAGALVGGTRGGTLIATGFVLPGLILQDACRMAFFAQSRAKHAALNDALWAVIQFTAIGVLIRTDHANAPTLVLAWGGAAVVCVGAALVQLGVVPRISATLSWFKEHRDLSGYLLGEYLLGAGAFNGGFLVVGLMVGDGALTSLRGAQVLLGPLGILSSAAITFALPELSRRTWLSRRARWRIALAVAAGMTLASLAYTVVLLLLPDSVGTFLFHDKWTGASAVFLAVAIGSTAAGTSLGPAVVIYAMGLARKTFRIMAIEAPLVFVLMISGARLGGAVGAAWGLALDQSLIIALWFLQLRAILREYPDGVPAPGEEPAPATPSADSPRAAADR
jgi:O-antigen/teichoic acid export membrane protein